MRKDHSERHNSRKYIADKDGDWDRPYSRPFRGKPRHARHKPYERHTREKPNDWREDFDNDAY